MKTIFATLIIVLLFLTCNAQVTSIQKIISGTGSTFQALGDLPGGSFGSAAYSVSSDGSVIVGYGTTNNGTQACSWTQATGMVSLGNLPDNYFRCSFAGVISIDGSMIFGDGDSTTSLSYTESQKGFRWTSETGMMPVIGLYGLTNGGVSDLSADNSVVVGSTNNQAFLWTQSGGMVGLGFLPGMTKSRAIAISDDGNTVTGSCWNVDNGAEITFIWTLSEGMKDIGFLPGHNSSFPNAISPDGSVIAGSSSIGNIEYPYYWTQSKGMVSLGHLPGKSTTHPLGVSTMGKIIVGVSGVRLDDGLAFIWDSIHGMRNLKTVLQSDYGIDLTGWTLQMAHAITPDGKVIIGDGKNPSGQSEGFRVELGTPITGIEDIKDETSKVAVYPNPTTGLVTIFFGTNSVQEAFVEIFNLQGKLVFSETFYDTKKETIDLTDFPKGTYLIVANTDRTIHEEKILKEK